MSNEPEITYSVRELIERLDRKIDQFIVLMNSKADRAEVALVEERLTDVESQVRALSDRLAMDEKKANTKREWRQWAIPVAIGIATLGATLLTIFVH